MNNPESPKQIDDPKICANTISELLSNHKQNNTNLVEVFYILHFFHHRLCSVAFTLDIIYAKCNVLMRSIDFPVS